jgi:hypothetical protein
MADLNVIMGEVCEAKIGLEIRAKCIMHSATLLDQLPETECDTRCLRNAAASVALAIEWLLLVLAMNKYDELDSSHNTSIIPYDASGRHQEKGQAKGPSAP